MTHQKHDARGMLFKLQIYYRIIKTMTDQIWANLTAFYAANYAGLNEP